MRTHEKFIEAPGYYLNIVEYAPGGVAKSVKVVVGKKKLEIARLLLISSFFFGLAFVLRIHEYSPQFLLCLITLQLFGLIYRVRHKVVTETLLLVGGIGAQSTITYYTGKCDTKFIPWTNLLDVIIAEAITMHQILYYIGCLIYSEGQEKSEQEIMPLFLHAWPRLHGLQEIYRSCRKVLTNKQNGRKHKKS